MANKYTRGQRLGKAIGKPCYYCGKRMYFDTLLTERFPTIDHVHPRSKGGQHTVWACYGCNQEKGALSEAEFRAVLAMRAHA